MSILVDGLSWVLLVAGSVWIVLGGVGLIRFPDFYTRLHPAGLTDTMGAMLILLGLTLQAGWSLIAVKLLAVALILLFTSPTSSHATARAAMAAGLEPWQRPGTDATPRKTGPSS
jgi:multicomponent Na+:H+ antiporter subunit G